MSKNIIISIITIIIIIIIGIIIYCCYKNSITESMKTMPNFSDSFCKIYNTKKGELEQQCSKLTRDTCKQIGCCNWLNGTKCVAGNEKGPVYKTDSNGELFNIDTFYYKNKCYGKGCSNLNN